MNDKLVFNNIELESDKAVFSKSLTGAILNPDWGSKNTDYSELVFGELTFEEVKEAKYYSEAFSLFGLQSLSYQVNNGGVNQYFYNDYNRDYSAISHLFGYLANQLIPFSSHLYGEQHAYTEDAKTILKALSLLNTLISEHDLNEAGEYEAENEERCDDCDGTGKISEDREDDSDEEIEEDCSNCDGDGRIRWTERYEYDFYHATSNTEKLYDFDLNAMFWDCLPSVEVLIELRCEYLCKSGELHQKIEDIER